MDHGMPGLPARVRGSLLAGAVGDALGAPVEFWSRERIEREVGPGGVRAFLPCEFSGVAGRGLVTDDTQMTLFTVEGLIRMLIRSSTRGSAPSAAVLHRAYWRWLDTQDGVSSESSGDGWLVGEEWLHSQRAPGITCLTALRATRGGDPYLRTQMMRNTVGEPAVNDSKGCGGVMRVAPVGFVPGVDHYALACEAAGFTHGHPSGQHAAGALAVVIASLAAGHPLADAIDSALERLAREPGAGEVSAALGAAVRRASAPAHAIPEELGEGWVAEEALAIAAYAALARTDDVLGALALAVSHSGDSDSTGAICGNILGALHGEAAVPASLGDHVEGRDTILRLADDLCAVIEAGEPGAWSGRYPPT